MHFRLRSPKIRLSENDIEKACKQLLQYHHFYAVRQQSGLFPAPGNLCDNCRRNARWIRVGEPGIPDYVIPRFFLETKAPGKKLSDIQREKILLLETQWNLKTAVVESLDELLAWLARHGEL